LFVAGRRPVDGRVAARRGVKGFFGAPPEVKMRVMPMAAPTGGAFGAPAPLGAAAAVPTAAAAAAVTWAAVTWAAVGDEGDWTAAAIGGCESTDACGAAPAPVPG
jgi:hypothetical protein